MGSVSYVIQAPIWRLFLWYMVLQANKTQTYVAESNHIICYVIASVIFFGA